MSAKLTTLAAALAGGLATAAVIAVLPAGRPTSPPPAVAAVAGPQAPLPQPAISRTAEPMAVPDAATAEPACGPATTPCADPAAALPDWFAKRREARPREQLGAYGDPAEVARVRENYYCDLAVQARENCEKLQRGEEHQKRCLGINLYYSYSRLCGRQP